MYFDTFESVKCYKSNSYKFSEDGQMINGDEGKYNKENRQKKSAKDLDTIFEDTLKLDVSDDEKLLSFVNHYGLPCSEAYATIDSFDELYFESYLSEKWPNRTILPSTTQEDFFDVCETAKTRNSLLIIQNMASLKAIYDANDMTPENSRQALSSILSIFINYNFEDLFIAKKKQ